MSYQPYRDPTWWLALARFMLGATGYWLLWAVVLALLWLSGAGS